MCKDKTKKQNKLTLICRLVARIRGFLLFCKQISTMVMHGFIAKCKQQKKKLQKNFWRLQINWIYLRHKHDTLTRLLII